MAWAAGQLVNKGKYKIERVLGEGGFGITYLAEICQRPGEKIVIKTLRDEIQKRGDFADFQQDFINEAIKLAKCNHPHVVAVGEMFQETVPHPRQQGQTLSLQCMPLDYVKGEDLEVYLRQQPQQRVSEQEALIYIRQVGEALTVAHRQNLLHRDVKPDNILLRRNRVSGQREAVLIDFGIAREFRQDVTQTHTQFYTPGFAPPEQYDRHAKRGAYTDIYALAATLYRMVTGHTLPEGSNRELSMLKYNCDLLEPPEQYNGGLSSSLCRAIMWGLEVETHKRPQQMEEWLQALPGGSSVAPPPVSPPSPSVPAATVPSPVPISTPRTVPAPPPPAPRNPQPPAPRNPQPPALRNPQPPVAPPRRKSSARIKLLNRRTFIGLGVMSLGGAVLLAQLLDNPGTVTDPEMVSTATVVDYTRLRDLLEAGQWKEADQETYQRMLEATNRTQEGWFRTEDLLNFPCADLQVIDQLWVQASQGRYGFSVQKEIYVKSGGKLDGNYPGDTIWRKFGDEVGWRVNGEWLSYDQLEWGGIGVPGHLPGILNWLGGYSGEFSLLLLSQCDL